MIKIACDLHTHTINSGHAYSTVDENARAASERGLGMIAITEHGPALPGGPHEYFFNNITILPQKLHGVRILRGVEANIMADGGLDLPEKTLEILDFIAAGLHSNTGHNLKTKDEFTKAMIKAIENPYVDMITHPASNYFPVDLEKVVKAASKNKVILELNASSFDPRKRTARGNKGQSIKLTRLCKRYGVPISVNSDAHFHTQVGDISTLKEVIEESGVKEMDIINTSVERVVSFLSPRLNPGKLII